MLVGYAQPPPWAPRWGIMTGTCPTYSGFGAVEEVLSSGLLEERLIQATKAAERAAYQAELNAALAQQAQDFNRSTIVGAIGAGAIALLMWAISQAIGRRG